MIVEITSCIPFFTLRYPAIAAHNPELKDAINRMNNTWITGGSVKYAPIAAAIIFCECFNLKLNGFYYKLVSISVVLIGFIFFRILSETTPTDLGSFESSKDGFLGTLTSTLVESLWSWPEIVQKVL